MSLKEAVKKFHRTSFGKIYENILEDKYQEVFSRSINIL